MRVAIRRLRSALRTFTPVLDKASVRWLREELGWLGGALGPVRDSDVLREPPRDAARDAARSDVLGPVRDELADLLHRDPAKGVDRSTRGHAFGALPGALGCAAGCEPRSARQAREREQSINKAAAETSAP